MFKVGCIFNFIFAPQDEESNQGACEQDYHTVEGTGRGFSAIELWQHAGVAKSYPGCHPASIWCETGRTERERRQLQDSLKESAL